MHNISVETIIKLQRTNQVLALTRSRQTCKVPVLFSVTCMWSLCYFLFFTVVVSPSFRMMTMVGVCLFSRTPMSFGGMRTRRRRLSATSELSTSQKTRPIRKVCSLSLLTLHLLVLAK